MLAGRRPATGAATRLPARARRLAEHLAGRARRSGRALPGRRDRPARSRRRATSRRRTRPTTRSPGWPRAIGGGDRARSKLAPADRSSATRSAARSRCSSRSTGRSWSPALVLINSAGLGTEISAELLDLMDGEPGRGRRAALLELFFEDKRLSLERGVEEMAQAQLADGAWAAAAGGRRRPASAATGSRLDLRERLGDVEAPTFDHLGRARPGHPGRPRARRARGDARRLAGGAARDRPRPAGRGRGRAGRRAPIDRFARAVAELRLTR